MNVMFFLRDITPGRIALPIIKLLRDQGDGVVIIAEGKALDLCDERSLHVVYYPESDELKPIGYKNLNGLLNTFNPEAICIGCSFPINWEYEAAKMAKERKIPLVAIEDIWGALSRLNNNIVPDLSLVIDSLASGQIRKNKLAKNCTVIGDIASIIDPPIPEEKKAAAERLQAAAKEKTVIMIVADHTRNALELVKIVADSVRLENKPDQFVISHSLVHPKLISTPEGDQILRPALALLDGLNIDQFDGLSTDARVVRANITTTAYSTVGRVAIHHGRRFVSVWGPEAEKLYFEENAGFDGYPLALNNIVPHLTKPRPFSSLDWRTFDLESREWSMLTKFRPEEAIQAIRRLVKKHDD